MNMGDDDYAEEAVIEGFNETETRIARWSRPECAGDRFPNDSLSKDAF